MRPAGRRSARGLTGHAAALAEAGLKLAWHNHDFEYQKLPDGIAADRPYHRRGRRLSSSPTSAGSSAPATNPATEIRKFPGKVAAFHIKDTAAAGVTKDDGWTDVGAGTIDWKGLWPSWRSGTIVCCRRR